MADSSEEKTEQPSAKKLRKERQEGHVPTSKEVLTAASVVILFYFLKLYGKTIYSTLEQFMVKYLGFSGGNVGIAQWSTSDGEIINIFIDVAKVVIITAGPLLVISALVSILATGVQTKFLFTAKAARPNFGKLNPINGIKNLFSMNQVVEILKSLLKITIMIAIIYTKLKSEIYTIAKFYDADVSSGFWYLCSVSFDIIITIGIACVAIAAVDYMYQRWKYIKDLRMTKQEVKEEYKQQEGDPQVKGKIKQKQQQMAMARMMQQVPTADVIVRNPTHFAIALKYDRTKHSAPIVIAKGQDHVAMKIIEIATEHNIAMREEPPLARALYAEVDLGKPIPPVYYEEVATILSWVYKLENRGRPD